MYSEKEKDAEAPAQQAAPWYAIGLVWVALAFAAIVFLMCITSWFGWSWLKHENAASWFQAIGSVVGIGVAVFVPAYQHRKQLQRDVENERREARRLLEITVKLAHVTNGAVHMSRTPPPGWGSDQLDEFRAIVANTVNGMLRHIGAVPFQAMPSAHAAGCLLSVQTAAQGIVSVMSQPLRRAHEGGPLLWYPAELIDAYAENSARNLRALKDELASYGDRGPHAHEVSSAPQPNPPAPSPA